MENVRPGRTKRGGVSFAVELKGITPPGISFEPLIQVSKKRSATRRVALLLWWRELRQIRTESRLDLL